MTILGRTCVDRWMKRNSMVRFISELRLMLECISGCFSALCWALLLLGFLLALFAIYFVQAVASFVRHHPELQEEDIDKYRAAFGSVQRGMLSLLETTTGGTDWNVHYVLLERIGFFPAALFLFFVMFFTIAVWNIITGLFLEKAMGMAKPDLESLAFERQSQDHRDIKELLILCRGLDADGSGLITFDEFADFMRNEQFRVFFDLRGIDIKDTEMFFRMLCSLDGMKDAVDLKTFVAGCLRLRGVPSCIDLHTLGFELKLMRAQQKDLLSFVMDMFEQLERPKGTTSNGKVLEREKTQESLNACSQLKLL
eukprot:TRINITY_DN38500_c0_g1_i1.p1 TRINITY_DN38500_c0_g1~~TRINITY_DN38500_c0_g1_i1.p1  ORF type:complete len:311 (+),score=66.09 TRINITY_DN38500_c0_g1_i1:94-1026(+)